LYPLFMTGVEELQEVRIELLAALERVERLLERASAPTYADNDQSVDIAALPRTKAIEWVLRHRGQPMRPVEIWSALQDLGRTDPKMEIQVTTYDLWQRDRIDKVGRGLYRAFSDASPMKHPATDVGGDVGMGKQRWSIDELRTELARFERTLRGAGLAETSIHTYVDRTARFIRWLDGDYQPQGSA